MRLPDNTLPETSDDFSWQTEGPARYIAMLLPCGHHANLPVEGDGAWSWDGNVEAPTLWPSILCMSRRVNREPANCWHGFMRGGVLVRDP